MAIRQGWAQRMPRYRNLERSKQTPNDIHYSVERDMGIVEASYPLTKEKVAKPLKKPQALFEGLQLN